jgi:hypothetical protein
MLTPRSLYIERWEKKELYLREAKRIVTCPR